MKQLETQETPGTAPLTRAGARASDGAESNQPPPFEGRNLYLTDRALRNAAEREGAAWAQERLEAWGGVLGSTETYALAARANRIGPELATTRSVRQPDRRGCLRSGVARADGLGDARRRALLAVGRAPRRRAGRARRPRTSCTPRSRTARSVR